MIDRVELEKLCEAKARVIRSCADGECEMNGFSAMVLDSGCFTVRQEMAVKAFRVATRSKMYRLLAALALARTKEDVERVHWDVEPEGLLQELADGITGRPRSLELVVNNDHGRAYA